MVVSAYFVPKTTSFLREEQSIRKLEKGYQKQSLSTELQCPAFFSHGSPIAKANHVVDK